MSTDYTNGMSPLDALSLDTGAFVSASSLTGAPQSVITGSEAGSVSRQSADFLQAQSIDRAMEFRVIRSGLPIRRLRLTGNRYTFGSANGCSIQLNDSSLRPMHAVLIRDANRILVRAYSVPIELNDTRITEASLQAGDVIRIGSYSFELLSTSVSQHDRPQPSSSALASPTSEDPTVWREQLRREVAQWRARQAECDRREGRCDDRENVLRSRESELWSRAEQLHRRESHLMAQESAALQIQEEYASKQQELLRLRDENRAKHQAYQLRETEFRNLEQEYREHVEEASRQLQQSQQQAEAATQAVKRMREQFADLNDQLGELQKQQSELQRREEQQTSEHQRLRLELEAARDAAIDGRAEEIVRRQEIEKRIAEMDANLRRAQAEYESERKRADESEEVAAKLREQIDKLHENIRLADDEATQLRQDYEQACHSVRSLEAMIEQGNTRGEMDRESWYGEAEELRQSVEQLSIDLARANGEIGDLRKANEQLSDRLNGLTRERDEAIDQLQSRPTQDAFASLRSELQETNDKLAEIQREYDETLARLESVQAGHRNAVHPPSTSEMSSPLWGTAGAIASGTAAWASTDTNRAIEDASSETDLSVAGVSDDVVAEQPYDWPTYDSKKAGDSSARKSLAFEIQDESLLDSTEPESLVFRSSPSQINDALDDAPRWSTEPMQKTDAPHFDTNASDDWDDADSNPQHNDGNFEAEFDRAADVNAIDNRYGSTNESVDQAIAQIEKGVDEAISIDVADESHSFGDEVQSVGQATQTSPWGYDVDAEQETKSEAHNEADVTSPWNSFESLDRDDQDSVAEDENTYVSSWQPTRDADDTHIGDNEQSMSLADQLIHDLESSTEDSADPVSGDQTYQWEKTVPFSRHDDDEKESVRRGWDQEYPEESYSSQWHNDSDGERTELIGNRSLESIQETPFAQPGDSGVAAALDDSFDASDDVALVDTDDRSLSAQVDQQPAVELNHAVEDDDSIEAYMNRLLNRVQGSAGSSTTATQSTPLVATPRTQAVDASSEPTERYDSNETVQVISPDAPLVPRSQAPERNSNLSAMRELANQSARTAVAHSVRIQARNTQLNAFVKFAQAGVAAMCAVACCVFLDWSVMLKLIIVGAILVIVGILLQEGLVLLKEAKGRLQSPAHEEAIASE